MFSVQNLSCLCFSVTYRHSSLEHWIGLHVKIWRYLIFSLGADVHISCPEKHVSNSITVPIHVFIMSPLKALTTYGAWVWDTLFYSIWVPVAYRRNVWTKRKNIKKNFSTLPTLEGTAYCISLLQLLSIVVINGEQECLCLIIFVCVSYQYVSSHWGLLVKWEKVYCADLAQGFG